MTVTAVPAPHVNTEAVTAGIAKVFVIIRCNQLDHDEVLSTNALEGYLLDDLKPWEKEAFESHMFDCRACTQELEFFQELRDVLRDDPELGERFHTPHRAAAYVLQDLTTEDRKAFELHMNACRACARNVRLGEDLLKRLLEIHTQPTNGTRLLNAVRFVRWFRLVFGD